MCRQSSVGAFEYRCVSVLGVLYVWLRHGRSHAVAPGHVPRRDHGDGAVMLYFSCPSGKARCGCADAVFCLRLHRVRGRCVPRVRVHLLSSLGVFVIRIRILMYPACILEGYTYPDVS
jgi:hypothetical protein